MEQTYKKAYAKLTFAFRKLATLPILFYRYLISPLLGPRCRFEPTCSKYAEDAILTHGIVRGTLLALRRLAKCHPWHPGGYDPLPSKNDNIQKPNQQLKDNTQ